MSTAKGSSNGRSALAVLMALLVSIHFVIHAPEVMAQTAMTVTVEIDKPSVEVAPSASEDTLVVLYGSVAVSKPPSKLIVVDVTLTSSVPPNMTATVEPQQMTFTEQSTQEFIFRITVPKGFIGNQQITAMVTGVASTPALPTEQDMDEVLMLMTYNYPVNPTNSSNNETTQEEEQTLGPEVAMMCGVSLIAGGVVGGLLFLRRKYGRKRTQVIYLARSDKGPDQDQG